MLSVIGYWINKQLHNALQGTPEMTSQEAREALFHIDTETIHENSDVIPQLCYIGALVSLIKRKW